jgi:long-chain fatty acid transport protein
MGILALLASSAMAGILTNNNQSATFIRLLSRNASLDVDAVYYNPAGLVKLSDGFHLSLHNQIITQDKKILNGFPLLNDPNYLGEVRVPFFPNLYAVYKKGNLAISFGVGPNAGGGTADFKTGLPSFEIPFSTLPVLISNMGVPTTGYDVDIAFKGESVFMGYQLNFSYALSPSLALGVGARLITATNKYEGSITNVMINPNGTWVSAYAFFMSVGQTGYAAMVADKQVDVKQTGTGFTPILSLNFTPSESLAFSLKYEFNTKLELTNKTTVDDTGMFPDGEKFRNDIPAILSAGLRYAFTPAFRSYLSFSYYFDRSANWEGAEALVNKNSYELGAGLEYDLSRLVTLSAGYLRTQFDLAPEYQDDINHELSSDTIGGGLKLNLTNRLSLELGAIYVFYKKYEKQDSVYPFPAYPVTFNRSTWDAAVGINYRF